MLKKFKKKSLKAKIAIIAFILFMLLLVAYVLYSNFKPEPPAEYEIAEVVKGPMTDTLDVSGSVESGLSENFIAVDKVTVEEVLVSVGDKVAKGDKLATFNVSGAKEYLSQAKKDYDNALAEYNNAKNSADSTEKKKAELSSQISKINSQINAKKNEISKLEKEIESAEPVTENVKVPSEQIEAIAAQMAQNGATAEQIEAFVAASSQITVPSVSSNSEKTQRLMQLNLELTQLNAELASLNAQNAVTVSVSSDDMINALKTVADAKKAKYDELEKVFNTMSNGWYAQNDGIVTVVNIKPGSVFTPSKEENTNSFDISSLLGSQGVSGNTSALISSLLGSDGESHTGIGITVESYEDMVVTVSVGKSDLLKIKTGMQAVVTSVGKEYEGEVIYVGATAAQSSGLDLGSITGSLMGGLSGSNGATVKVKIKNPDEKVVIGFDVDIKIKLCTIEDVLKIPVECVIYDNSEYFVYVFDSDKNTVKKKQITRGSLDDSCYEVLEGLNAGEKVVKSPAPHMEDGTKIKSKGI